jgi:hypothetical protein
MGDARPESSGGFVTLEEWMLDIFNTVYEIVIFALVCGYTRAGREYYGSLEYTARWVKCSSRTVFRTLSSLVERGYLDKRETAHGAVKRCYYTVNNDNVHAAIDRLRGQRVNRTIDTESTAPLTESQPTIDTESMYTTIDIANLKNKNTSISGHGDFSDDFSSEENTPPQDEESGFAERRNILLEKIFASDALVKELEKKTEEATGSDEREVLQAERDKAEEARKTLQAEWNRLDYDLTESQRHSSEPPKPKPQAAQPSKPEQDIKPTQNAPPMDYGKRWEIYRKLWNELKLPPPCNLLFVKPIDRDDVHRTFSIHTHEQVIDAIHNYKWHRDTANPAEYKDYPNYQSMAGFLKTGVEKYHDDGAFDALFKIRGVKK